MNGLKIVSVTTRRHIGTVLEITDNDQYIVNSFFFVQTHVLIKTTYTHCMIVMTDQHCTVHFPY